VIVIIVRIKCFLYLILKWLVGAIALSMSLHFMILEVDVLSVSTFSQHYTRFNKLLFNKCW